MLRTSLFYVIISLVLSSTLGDKIRNVSGEVYVRSEGESRFEGSPKVYKINETMKVSISNSSLNSSLLIDENDKPRDKRALGVILQGLAEAFGYTVSPVSISVLPNPNTTAATAAAAPPTVFTFPGIATPPPPPPAAPQRPNPPAPRPQRPQKPLPPTITTTMSPRQKETLRFTGVVNFGNNSDLLGHLRRYEQIFHGPTTTTVAPPPPPPRPPPTSGSTKLGLLPPFFVKIPLPIAPNLPPLLPPSAPRQIKQMTYKESYESGEITDEKDVRTTRPEGHRDTYVDEPEWMKKEREQQNNKYREEDSSEESDQNGGSNKYRETAERQREDSRNKEREESQEEEDDDSEENDEKNNYREDEESNSYKKDERENDERRNQDEEDEEDSREHYATKKPLLIKYTKDSEEKERDNDTKDYESDEEESERERYKGNANNQDFTTLKNNVSSFGDSFDFVTQTNPIVPKQFGTGLPIRVFDVPFNNPGDFRNSYGQSLEHDGRTDDSLADYFQRYKHPETGLYDSDKLLNLEAPQRREPWWQNDPEIRRAAVDPLQQIRQEYTPTPKAKYEEYRLNDHPGKRRAPTRQNARRKNQKEALKEDGIAEPTVTTYAQVKAPKTMKRRSNHVEEKSENDREEKRPRRPSKAPKNRKPIVVKRRSDHVEETFENDHEEKRPRKPSKARENRKPIAMKRRSDRVEETSENDDEERRSRKPSNARENLKRTATKKISKVKRNENANASSLKTFDIVRYNPYFRPLQIAYEPEKLQRTAERILSYHNFGKNGKSVDALKVTTKPSNDDEKEENSSERSIDSSEEKSQPKPEVTKSEKQTGSPPHKIQYPLHNAYVKPIQYVYQPEGLQKTADRILSYGNLGHLKRKPDENGENGREEAEEEGEQPEVRDSPEKLKEDEEEQEARDSPENLREDEEEPEARDSPEKLREDEDQEHKSEEHHSSENLKEQEDDDESSENLRVRESDENEPEANRSPKYVGGPEAEEEEETERDRSSEDWKEAFYQEPEEYRSSDGNSRERYYQESEDNGSGENPRSDHQESLKVYRCSGESEENCDEKANRHSENLKENKDKESEANRSSENLRENRDEEPEANHSSENLRENSEEKPEANHSSENLQENSDDEPEANRFSEKLQYYETPEVGLPERLTGKNLHEGEDKAVQAWPAPFDYTFDSTESTRTIQAPNYSEIPYENVEPTRLAPAIYKQYYIRNPGDDNPPNVSPTYGTPSIIELRNSNNAASYYQDLAIAPTDESSTYVIPPYHVLPESHRNVQVHAQNSSVYYDNPQRNNEQLLTEQNAAQKIQFPSYAYQKFVENKSRNQNLSKQPEVYVPEVADGSSTRKQHERLHEPEATRRYDKENGKGGEIPRGRLPVGPTTFDSPESAHEFFGLSPDDYELAGQTFGQRKSNGNIQSPNTTPLNPTSDKLIQLLAVKQEDPNYQRDVVLTEFTDEPESDTEKVRVKEYRNKVATIEVSERKQLTPDGPVRFLGFTRNF